MAIRCANCGNYYSRDELSRAKPPVHVWQLTRAGAAALAENQRRGSDQLQCPGCGNRTLV